MANYNFDRNTQSSKNGYTPNNKYADSRKSAEPKETPEAFLNQHPFSKEWIIQGADEKLVDFADHAGKYMKDGKLTNSKIRSVYGEIKRIQVGGLENHLSSFYLLKPKVAYAVGRDPHNEGLLLFQKIFDECFLLVAKDPKRYNNFCNLIEAVLAYHKAYGGKD